MRELLPAVIYFVITFNIIGFTKVLMLRAYGSTVSTCIGATFGALLVAKAVLTVGVLPFMEPCPKLPIVYNVFQYGYQSPRLSHRTHAGAKPGASGAELMRVGSIVRCVLRAGPLLSVRCRHAG